MIKKNKRRIDPRYFLNETTNRDNLADDLSPLSPIQKEARTPVPVHPDYVMNALTQGRSALTNDSFMEIVITALESGDIRRAANGVMDALWIDDPSPGAERGLESMLSDAYSEEDVAEVGTEWLTQFRTPGGWADEGDRTIQTRLKPRRQDALASAHIVPLGDWGADQ